MSRSVRFKCKIVFPWHFSHTLLHGYETPLECQNLFAIFKRVFKDSLIFLLWYLVILCHYQGHGNAGCFDENEQQVTLSTDGLCKRTIDTTLFRSLQVTGCLTLLLHRLLPHFSVCLPAAWHSGVCSLSELETCPSFSWKSQEISLVFQVQPRDPEAAPVWPV